MTHLYFLQKFMVLRLNNFTNVTGIYRPDSPAPPPHHKKSNKKQNRARSLLLEAGLYDGTRTRKAALI
jgi:hypothetical protein